MPIKHAAMLYREPLYFAHISVNVIISPQLLYTLGHRKRLAKIRQPYFITSLGRFFMTLSKSSLNFLRSIMQERKDRVVLSFSLRAFLNVTLNFGILYFLVAL
jgi:hypothetical protein